MAFSSSSSSSSSSHFSSSVPPASSSSLSPAASMLARAQASLDADQRAAVTAPFAHPLIVVAGPGSGKTRMLTSRVAAAVAQGADCHRICMLTFTRAACDEMRARLAALLGTQAAHAVRPTTPHRERQDLNVLLHDTLKLLEPDLVARKISVQLDLADSLPPAMIDQGQFQQVFYNLIRNAYQATAGEDGRITIRTRVNDYEYIVSIEDNGTGISPEHMGALFEPYRTTKSSGSGLGLLIVRRIIREHGGEIAIESEVNQGTRVLIHLPRSERSVRLLGAPDADPVIDL